MPRLPGFDRHHVLFSAMAVFWENGYEASSVQKLLSAMAINRGSLYATFISKENLFREAISLYRQEIARVMKSTLIDMPDPIAAVHAFFYQMFLHADGGSLSKGCLLFNTVSELANTCPELADEAAHSIEELRQLFEKRLAQAQVEGRLNSTESPAALSHYLIALLAGLRIHCKMGTEREMLHRVISVGLHILQSKNN